MIQEIIPVSYLLVSLSEQQIHRMKNKEIVASYPVSTAKNGAGELFGSECTPQGWHRIRAKIGEGQPLMSVFTARRPTGEMYTSELAINYPERDWILTRILWLSGLETGKNRMGNVDSMRRYIYIHGSPDHCVSRKPESHGCIRMRNNDVRELFDQVSVNLPVLIK
ncbi:MAG: L,D-transpeptidase [Methylococcales bacterium]